MAEIAQFRDEEIDEVLGDGEDNCGVEVDEFFIPLLHRDADSGEEVL